MKRFVVAVSILFTVGCVTTTPVATSQAPRPLTVALFPYIPDAGGDNFKALIAGLTSKFQQTHPDIQLTITMSGDPYEQPEVIKDWMYQQFQPAFRNAQGFPNQGFPAARKTLQKQLCTTLQATIPDACKQ